MMPAHLLMLMLPRPLSRPLSQLTSYAGFGNDLGIVSAVPSKVWGQWFCM